MPNEHCRSCMIVELAYCQYCMHPIINHLPKPQSWMPSFVLKTKSRSFDLHIPSQYQAVAS